jgi:hypothetical protein
LSWTGKSNKIFTGKGRAKVEYIYICDLCNCTFIVKPDKHGYAKTKPKTVCCKPCLEKHGLSKLSLYLEKKGNEKNIRNKIRSEPLPLGTIRVAHNGYKIIAVPKGTPGAYSFSYKSTSFMLLHRYVMQKFLGRPLTNDETVHHRNGNRADNCLENLELYHGRHGPGASEYTDCINSIVKINRQIITTCVLLIEDWYNKEHPPC